MSKSECEHGKDGPHHGEQMPAKRADREQEKAERKHENMFATRDRQRKEMEI